MRAFLLALLIAAAVATVSLYFLPWQQPGGKQANPQLAPSPATAAMSGHEGR